MAITPKKPGLSAANAISEINRIAGAISGVTAVMLGSTSGMMAGKLYELYALSILLEELAVRGWSARFVGTSIKMKASPGFINAGDDHFELDHRALPMKAALYTDIQVATLGSVQPGASVTDLSEYHEIDVVVVEKGVVGMPRPDQLLIGLECKATANFSKSFVREALGRRRELSFYSGTWPCLLDGSQLIDAHPPSEYRLVFIDPAGLSYVESPAVFGVELEHWQP